MEKPFVVSKEPKNESELHEVAPELLQLSGDTKADTETALRALAFVMEFLNEVGPGELRRCADEIRASRVRR